MIIVCLLFVRYCWLRYCCLESLDLPRIARPGAVCLVSIRGQARKARMDHFELEKLELANLSSTRVSNCSIPPSEVRRWGRSSRMHRCCRHSQSFECKCRPSPPPPRPRWGTPIRRTPPRRGCPIGWHHLSNATCLLRPRLVCVVISVRDRHNLPFEEILR